MRRRPGKIPSFASAFFAKDLDPADPALSHRPRWNSTETISLMLLPEFREKLQAYSRPDKELLAHMPAGHEDWDPLSRAQWLEYRTLLPGYILSSQGDRMLMANSVEGRFPFLDRGLIDLANSFPARHKLFGLDEKHILKREFADLLPESILHRPKQPYRSPDASCFFSSSPPDWMEEAVSDRTIGEAGVFEKTAVRALFAKCAAVRGRDMSNTDNMRVLAVLSTQLAHLQFIAGDGSGHGRTKAPEPILVIDMLKRGK
jgi:asparagine synthase (glutamine-hydrolysing)